MRHCDHEGLDWEMCNVATRSGFTSVGPLHPDGAGPSAMELMWLQCRSEAAKSQRRTRFVSIRLTNHDCPHRRTDISPNSIPINGSARTPDDYLSILRQLNRAAPVTGAQQPKGVNVMHGW
jgi:hypothetical protein